MITVIEQQGELVLQQVTHPKTGELLRYQYGKPGDAASIIHVQTLEEGRRAIAPVIYTTVDRNGEMVVRKVTKNGKLVGYEYNIGVGFIAVPTLVQARKAIGKVK